MTLVKFTRVKIYRAKFTTGKTFYRGVCSLTYYSFLKPVRVDGRIANFDQRVPKANLWIINYCILEMKADNKPAISLTVSFKSGKKQKPKKLSSGESWTPDLRRGRLARFLVPCKGIQDSLGFWIPRRGFRVPMTGFQIFCSGTWILDSYNCILDSKAQDSGFH